MKIDRVFYPQLPDVGKPLPDRGLHVERIDPDSKKHKKEHEPEREAASQGESESDAPTGPAPQETAGVKPHIDIIA